MGVATNFKVSFYTRDKKFIEKYDLEGRIDDFITGFLNDGGAVFDPKEYGDFNESQMEIMKIYFDEESMSVGEGYAKVTPNIQEPKELEKIWTIVRNSMIKSFNTKLKEYRSSMLVNIDELKSNITTANESKSSLFAKKNMIKIPGPKNEIDDYSFDRLLFDYTWSLNSISKIMAVFEIATKNDYLIEITASDG